MITVPASVRIHLALGATDMRKSFDGLSFLVQEVLRSDPFGGHLFIFRSKRAGTVKILFHDGNGGAGQGSISLLMECLRRDVPVRQALGPGRLHLADDAAVGGRHGIGDADAGAALDAVGRSGMADTSADAQADDRRLTAFQLYKALRLW